MVVGYGSSIVLSHFSSVLNYSHGIKRSKNKFSTFIWPLAIFFHLCKQLDFHVTYSQLSLSEKPFELRLLQLPVVFNFECNDDTAYCVFKENSIINFQSYTLIIYFSFFGYVIIFYCIIK